VIRQFPPIRTTKVSPSREASARAGGGDSLIPRNLAVSPDIHQIFFRAGRGRPGAILWLAAAAPPAILGGAMRHHTFLFDLDGTLVDHFAAIHRSHAHTLRALGLPEPTPAQVRAAVGGGLEVAIARLAGPERVPAALAIYRPYWDATMLDDVALLPGARELLIALKAAGARTAVFTNKHGPSSRKVCAHLGLDGLLDGNFGATDTPWLKPAPEFARHVLQALGAQAGATAMVGDSPYDLAAARNGGLEFFGVTTGTHTAEELRHAGAAAVYTDLVALHPVLLA
jgi:phosphoglycolate phosphatase